MKLLLIALMGASLSAQILLPITGGIGAGGTPNCSACTLSQTPQNKTITSGTSDTFAYNVNNGAGHLLTFEVEQNGGINVTGITDLTGNTWSNVVVGGTVGNQKLEIWYAPHSIAGANALTISYNGTVSYGQEYIQEWTGPSTSPLDAVAMNQQGVGSTASTGAFSISANSLVIAIGMMSNCGSTAAGAGYTSLGTDTCSLAQYQIVPGTSATATVTGTSGNWAIIGASFK